MRSGPTHTKSRTGCLVCKARRIKCDEGHPRCRRCIAGRRNCEYAGNWGTRQVSAILPTGLNNIAPAATPSSVVNSSTETEDPSSHIPIFDPSRLEHDYRFSHLGCTSPGTGPQDQRSSDASANPRTTPRDTISHIPTISSRTKSNEPFLHTNDTQQVFTALHMRLLSHAIAHMTSYMASEDDMQPLIDYALHCADKSPYVLHQLLALSALHCSTQQPEVADEFFYHATDLQTRALSNFSIAKDDDDKSASVPAFVFAALLGIHILYVTLAKEHNSMAGFIADLVAFLRVYRGVRSVANGNWDEIRASSLEPLLSVPKWIERNEKSGCGSETHRLRELLGTLPDQSNSSVQASLEALEYIQWMLDLKTRAPPSSGLRVHVTLAWPVVVSNEYVDCVYQHRPEALAVLAFFAAALHQHPGFWGFSKAGPRLVRLIVEHVGPFWSDALTWPCESTLDD